MQGFRVWTQVSAGVTAGPLSPFFEQQARAEATMTQMNGAWDGRPGLEVKEELWPPGAKGYFGDETTTRPL